MSPAPDARGRILAACREEIAERGLRGLRVQDVAKRAGVSLGLVYYHFTDRAGLLRAVLESVNDAAAERGAAAAHAPGEDPVLAALAEEFGDDPEVRGNSVVWNEMRALAVFEADLRSPLAASTRLWNDAIAERLRADPAGQDPATGRASSDRAVLLTVLVEGLSSRWLSGQIDTTEALRLLSAGTATIRAAEVDAAAIRAAAPEDEEE